MTFGNIQKVIEDGSAEKELTAESIPIQAPLALEARFNEELIFKFSRNVNCLNYSLVIGWNSLAIYIYIGNNGEICMLRRPQCEVEDLGKNYNTSFKIKFLAKFRENSLLI